MKVTGTVSRPYRHGVSSHTPSRTVSTLETHTTRQLPVTARSTGRRGPPSEDAAGSPARPRQPAALFLGAGTISGEVVTPGLQAAVRGRPARVAPAGDDNCRHVRIPVKRATHSGNKAPCCTGAPIVKPWADDGSPVGVATGVAPNVPVPPPGPGLLRPSFFRPARISGTRTRRRIHGFDRYRRRIAHYHRLTRAVRSENRLPSVAARHATVHAWASAPIQGFQAHSASEATACRGGTRRRQPGDHPCWSAPGHRGSDTCSAFPPPCPR